MQTTIHSFNHLYIDLLKLNTIEDAQEYVVNYEKHKYLLFKTKSEESFKKALVLKSNYINKLFDLKYYDKLRVEIDGVLEDFMHISEMEKNQTNLYREVMEISAKVHFHFGNYDIARKEFEFLNEKFPSSKEYPDFLHRIRLKNQKQIKINLLLITVVSLSSAFLFIYVSLEKYFIYPFILGLLSILCLGGLLLGNYISKRRK